MKLETTPLSRSLDDFKSLLICMSVTEYTYIINDHDKVALGPPVSLALSSDRAFSLVADFHALAQIIFARGDGSR